MPLQHMGTGKAYRSSRTIDAVCQPFASSHDYEVLHMCIAAQGTTAVGYPWEVVTDY